MEVLKAFTGMDMLFVPTPEDPCPEKLPAIDLV